MAATPYPIPRGKRVTDVLAGNGGKTYGPFSFKIFDIEDVEVVARAQGAAKYSVAVVTVQKASSAALDYFTITFSDNIPASTSFQVRGRRVAERSAGVQKGTMINPDALERELSKISLQAQEARRDALPLDPDIQEGDTVAWSPSGWRKGANADDIASAQVYAAEALASKQGAADLAAQAQGSATAASGSANLAGRWATAPENEEVVPTSGLFSAFHWYRKTLAIWNSVIAGWSSAVHNAPSKASPSLADEFGFADSGDSWKIKKQTFAKLQEVFGVPIGTAIMMPGNGNTPPPGFLLMNGAPCTSAYPQLRAWLLANGATVNGNGDPIIEDMGGYFPRGWRPGQVVDSGRVFGSAQQDAFQNHRHPHNRVTNATVSSPVNNNQQGPVGYIVPGYVNTPQPEAVAHGATLPDGENGTPRVAPETRPINKTFTYWIKAYAADLVPGSADFAALANNVQSAITRLSALEADPLFVSLPQTVIGSGVVTVGHPLGKLPSWITLDFVNIVAEGGYSVGDTVNVAPSLPDNYGAHGITVSKTTTNVIVIFSSGGIYINQKTGGAPYLMNPTRWQMIVRAKA